MDNVFGLNALIKENKIRIVVDAMDANTEIRFNAGPERIIIVDNSRRVAFKGGYGPFYFDPRVVDTFFGSS